jgi:hypothetical protein
MKRASGIISSDCTAGMGTSADARAATLAATIRKLRRAGFVSNAVVLIGTTHRVVEWTPQHERTLAHAEGRT